MRKGQWYNHYLSRINKKYFCLRTMTESGTICEIRYKSASSGITRNYFCLMLNNGWGPHPRKKTHLLSLEYLPPKLFDEFVEQVGLEFSSLFKKVRKLKIEKLLMERKDAGRFYIKEIKPDIDTMFKNTYRTFSIENIQRINVLDFKFKNKRKILNKTYEKQVKQQLRKKKDILNDYDVSDLI